MVTKSVSLSSLTMMRFLSTPGETGGSALRDTRSSTLGDPAALASVELVNWRGLYGSPLALACEGGRRIAFDELERRLVARVHLHEPDAQAEQQPGHRAQRDPAPAAPERPQDPQGIDGQRGLVLGRLGGRGAARQSGAVARARPRRRKGLSTPGRRPAGLAR